MFIPIRTSIRPRRTPYANYILIGLNIFFFIVTYWPHPVRLGRFVFQEPLREWAQQFMLQPANIYLWQFVSYAFLHGSLMHIVGNMYFLFLFGNNVNDRLGNVSYLCLYLAGGVFAGIGHVIVNHTNPVLGASGAVAAVTGAYLVLFPRTLITVLYWFFFIGTFELSALYFIAFKLIVWDNVVEPGFAPQSVAYEAHLAGYGFGVFACLSLLALGIVAKTQTDLWFLIKQWNRRRRYREAVYTGYDPFTGRGGAKKVNAKISESPEQQAREAKVADFRSEISSFINGRNLQGAAEKYIELLEVSEDHVLPTDQQLDVANQLMSTGQWSRSAQAYQIFLKHYPGYKHVEQIHLILGILYCRYLKEPELAREHLGLASEKLTDPGQIRMCVEELDRLGES